jgi:hypothetical protein
MKSLFSSFLLFIFSQSLLAGGWVFGGGDQVGNKHNPWFLASQQKIQYCVTVDQQTISGDENQIHQLVSQSLEYWRHDFEKLNKIVSQKFKSMVSLSLPTQGFEEVSCHLRPALRFIFGTGSLSLDEKKFLSDFDFVAASVRTEYDEISLLGQGLIYIPSDLGPNSFVKFDQVERPWEKAGLLKRVLIHEIGHIYGMQHSDFGIMMSDYPETILKKKSYWAFTNTTNIPSTLLPQLNHLKSEDSTISHLEWGIKLVRVKEKLTGPETLFFPSGVTLEWSLAVKTPTGENQPMMIRSGPFLYESYSLHQNTIQKTKRMERQCRPRSCFKD